VGFEPVIPASNQPQTHALDRTYPDRQTPHLLTRNFIDWEQEQTGVFVYWFLFRQILYRQLETSTRSGHPAQFCDFVVIVCAYIAVLTPGSSELFEIRNCFWYDTFIFLFFALLQST
jgi:hypothetical protein